MLILVIIAIIIGHLFALSLCKTAKMADEQLSNSQEGKNVE